jgi:hypothetical protein
MIVIEPISMQNGGSFRYMAVTLCSQSVEAVGIGRGDEWLWKNPENGCMPRVPAHMLRRLKASLPTGQRGPACQMPMMLPAGSRMVAIQRFPSG